MARDGSLVLTGGTTAERIYPPLASTGGDWSQIAIFFSDERCVPPDDARSNFGMARRLLLDRVGATNVVRMKGEVEPDVAAGAYDSGIRPAVEARLDLVVLGMGSDCHVAALFPGSAALEEQERLCVAVARPDGLTGLTLTPPALLAAKQVLLVAAGEAKAEAVRRAVGGDEQAATCPARLLADHPDATFLLDEPAAALL